MAWITPKTDWVGSDYFNLDPDYARIKGNIEYLIELSKTMYPEYQTPALTEASIDGYPTVSFFNDVVEATQEILNRCYAPASAREMRLYEANGRGWNADELNVIENNHLLLYKAFHGQQKAMPKLAITLGGVQFGG